MAHGMVNRVQIRYGDNDQPHNHSSWGRPLEDRSKMKQASEV
jgi:hypothetical protein